MFKQTIIITIIILVLYIALRYFADRNSIVLEKDLLDKSKGFIIIDVRSELEWNEWHHPKAIHIPYYDIEKVLDLVKNKEDKIILYCNTARRANIALKKLQEFGYNNVEILDLEKSKRLV